MTSSTGRLKQARLVNVTAQGGKSKLYEKLIKLLLNTSDKRLGEDLKLYATA